MDNSLALVTIDCPDCGPGYAPLEVVTLRVNIEHGATTMAFPCPLCGVRAALAISARSVALLLEAGIEPEFWRAPAELSEGRPNSLPPLRRGGLFRHLVEEIDADIAALFHDVNADGDKG